jgi:hypothetical protein
VHDLPPRTTTSWSDARRSIYILDDLTPLRSGRRIGQRRPVHGAAGGALAARGPDLVPRARPGENPPAGAAAHYWLKRGKEDVRLEVLDEQGWSSTLSSRKVRQDDPPGGA